MKQLRYVSTLYYYDGPQVIEARDRIGGHYVGVLADVVNGIDRNRLGMILAVLARHATAQERS